VLLSNWTCISSFCVVTVRKLISNLYSLNSTCTVNVLCCCVPEHVAQLLCNYRTYSSFAKSTHWTLFVQKVCCAVLQLNLYGSFCIITVSTVDLQTVHFIQYLYSKSAVLLCSWTGCYSFCVITVRTVHLQTLHSVPYLYAKYAVLFRSRTCIAASA